MTQLEEIQKLMAKKKEYKIPKKPKPGQEQAKLEIMPLSLEEMDLLDLLPDDSTEVTIKKLKKLMAKSFGVEEDKVNIAFGNLTDIMNAIKDANNVSEEDMKKTGIKEFIAKKQKLIEEQAKKKENDIKPSG